MTSFNNDKKIFGIGLSRTGTLSLTNALSILGIKTKHFPDDKITQKELRTGQYQLSILNDYEALTDIPISPYYAEFYRLFNNSKFILTTRPIDSWLESVKNHFNLWVKYMRDDYNDYVHACVYGVLEFQAERFRHVYELHDKNVREYFADKPGRLLVINFFEGDGWDKLCNFLECPIPDLPFPHKNKRRKTPPVRHKKIIKIKNLLKSITK